MRMGEVGHDITTFSGTLLCQSTEPKGRLHFQKVTLWDPVILTVCRFVVM